MGRGTDEDRGNRHAANEKTECQREAGPGFRDVQDSGLESTEFAAGTAAAAARIGLPEVDAEHYRIEKEVARGGMGEIYLAHDRRTDRPVALKRIPRALLEQSSPHERHEYLARFDREARITAQLQHPAIVPVYEIGELDEAPFFAMKMVSGEALDQAIERATTLEERLGLLEKITTVADAIAYAHEQGVIHRDLKPANILCGRHGETVVIDWGLAKAVTDDDMEGSDTTVRVVEQLGAMELTEAGAVFGTPQYMSPEQARSEQLDRRTDVYAIGAILYRLLGGRPAYLPRPGAENQSLDVVAQLAESPPTPLGRIEPDVPADLQSIVARAMAHDPTERYPDAAELAADLRRFQARQLVTVHHYSFGEHVARAYRRNPFGAWATALLVVAAIFAGSEWAEHAKEEAHRKEVDRLRAEALFDAGREAVYRQNFARGATLLAHAYRDRPNDRATQILLGEALQGLDGLIFSLSLSEGEKLTPLADGNIAIAGDGVMTIWNPRSGTKRVVNLPGGDQYVHASWDGRRAVGRFGRHRKQVVVWDLDTGDRISEWAIGDDDVPVDPLMTVSHTGRWVQTGAASFFLSRVIWDAETGEQRLITHAGGRWFPETSSFVDSGLVAARQGDDVLLFDLEARTELLRVRLPLGPGAKVTAIDAHTIGVIGDSNPGSWLVRRHGPPIAIPEPSVELILPRIGTEQFLTLGAKSVSLWHIDTDGRPQIVDRNLFPTDTVFASLRPDGRQLAILERNRVVLYSLGTPEAPDLRVEAVLPTPANPHSADYSSDGKLLTIVSRHRAQVYSIDLIPHRGRSIDYRHAPFHHLAPDGGALLVVHPNAIDVWDTRTTTRAATIPFSGGRSSGVAFSPSGKLLVADGKVWEAGSWKKLRSLDDHPALDQVLFLDEERIVAVTAGEARIINIRSGKQVGALERLNDDAGTPGFFVLAAAVASDAGTRVAGMCSARFACVWGTSGRILRRYSAGVPMAFLSFDEIAFSFHSGEQAGVHVHSIATGTEVLYEPGARFSKPTRLGPEPVSVLPLSLRGGRTLLLSSGGRREELWLHSPPTVHQRSGHSWKPVAVTGNWTVVRDARSLYLYHRERGLLMRELPASAGLPHTQMFQAAIDRGLNTIVTQDGPQIRVWPLPREQRPASDVIALIERELEMTIVDGRAVPVPPRPADAAVGVWKRPDQPSR